MNQVVSYPWMGGKKGRANLIHQRKTLVGAGTYDRIRREVARLCGRDLASRRRSRPALPPFELPEVDGLDQVWAGDGLKLKAWGLEFTIVAFLDVFNQEYLAVDATVGQPTSDFAARCFEEACDYRDGRPPTVCTKTDHGSEFQGAFSEALQGRVPHLRIPPGMPWFNGESERGNRDLRAVVVGHLPRRRPRPGQELTTLQRACRRAMTTLNDKLSRPSLGNVTPTEVARGTDNEVRRGNERFVAHQRQLRKEKSRSGDIEPWKDRLARLFCAEDWTSSDLLRFLRLKRRDYQFLCR